MYKFISIFLLTISMNMSVFAVVADLCPEEEMTTEQIIQFEKKEAAYWTAKTESNSIEDLDIRWSHQIASIDDSGYEVELEDGSIWHIINWWGHFAVKGWKEGDVIFVTCDFSRFGGFKLRNITTRTTVSGYLQRNPLYDSSNVKFVQSIQDHYTSVLLNDGRYIKSVHSGAFNNWKEDDIVISVIMEDEKKYKTPYALWNIFQEELTWDLQIEE